MEPRQLEEFRNLRATVKDRGTARVVVFVVGLTAWGAVSMAAWGAERAGWAFLVPLVVLVGAFEAVVALHVGAERIGRYIAAVLERGDPGWEHYVTKVGAAGAMRPGGDGLFSWVFIAALAANLVPVLTTSRAPAELIVLVGAHLAALGRVLDARHRAAGQRAADLAAFQQVRDSVTAQSGSSDRAERQRDSGSLTCD
jgi:hypothetical protein